MPSSINIIFGTEQLILLSDRALHWPAQKTLVLADVHLGKDASFRAAGLPVPSGNSPKDLARIESLLKITAADRLVILGDMVHSRTSHQSELAAAFTRWRSNHQKLEILLIRGNHDRHAGPPPVDWQITQVPEPFNTGSLIFSHFPRPSDQPLLCGHVHPTIAVRDFDRTYAAIPCFIADPTQMILPAFGSFTGGCAMRSEPGRRIFAAVGKSIIEIKK